MYLFVYCGYCSRLGNITDPSWVIFLLFALCQQLLEEYLFNFCSEITLGLIRMKSRVHDFIFFSDRKEEYCREGDKGEAVRKTKRENWKRMGRKVIK